MWLIGLAMSPWTIYGCQVSREWRRARRRGPEQLLMGFRQQLALLMGAKRILVTAGSTIGAIRSVRGTLRLQRLKFAAASDGSASSVVGICEVFSYLSFLCTRMCSCLVFEAIWVCWISDLNISWNVSSSICFMFRFVI